MQQAKDPAAVSLGRRGGLIGGHARAAALTREERQVIARKAAAARWERATEPAVVTTIEDLETLLDHLLAKEERLHSQIRAVEITLSLFINNDPCTR